MCLLRVPQFFICHSCCGFWICRDWILGFCSILLCGQIIFYINTSSEHTTKELARACLDMSSILVVVVYEFWHAKNLDWILFLCVWVSECVMCACVNLSSFSVEMTFSKNARDNIAICTTTPRPWSVQKTFTFMTFCNKRFHLHRFIRNIGFCLLSMSAAK